MTDESPGIFGDIKSFWANASERQGSPGLQEIVTTALRSGVQAVALFRLYSWLHERGLRVLPMLLSRVNFFLTGADIAPGARIGPGCRIWHTAGIVIGDGVVVGSEVRMLHNVTLASKIESVVPGEPCTPTIGDRVTLYTGATVLGDVVVGDDCVIGAYSIVLEDLPPGSLAVGSPARVVREVER
jgi:serine O-acetyltransferase